MKTSLLWLALLLNMHTNAQDTIAKQDIVSAAKLFHLQFTPKEIDTMYAGIKENLGVYASMHRNSINNQTPMSLWQNPQVPGLVIQQQQKPIKWAFNKSVALPQNQADLAFYSIADLSVLIKQKKISSVALTQLFINRIKFYADSLQCVISITDSMALVQAAAADAESANGIYRGPLHGIPYGLKDLFAVKGTKTTWGAEPYKNQVIEEDAYVYQRLKEAGAVLVA